MRFYSVRLANLSCVLLLGITTVLRIEKAWASMDFFVGVGRGIVMSPGMIVALIMSFVLHLTICFCAPVDFRILDMQRQSGAALCRGIGSKYDQRCRLFFYDPGKSKPGGKRYLPHQPLLNSAQINDDKSQTAILDQNVRSLESLLDRLHPSSFRTAHLWLFSAISRAWLSLFPTAHPQKPRQVHSSQFSNLRVKAVAGVD